MSESIWRAAYNLRCSELWEMESPPWEYDSPRPDDLTSKAKFRKWQNDEETQHVHFTLVESVNPHLRVEKENPPLCIHGWVADFDADIAGGEYPCEFFRRLEHLDPDIRPRYISKTFSKGLRVVWVFEEKVWADCSAVLEKFLHNFAARVKAKAIAPGLDTASFQPHMLWELGTDWEEVPDSTEVPPSVTRQIFKDSIAQVKKVDRPYSAIPMEEIQAEIERKYPGRLFGSKVDLGERIPIFWLPKTGDHKERDKSAMVAEWGCYSFSSRSDKGCVFWDELLGEAFVTKFREMRLGQATDECYYDGKGYWRLDSKGMWRFRIAAEIKAAGIDVDLNKAV